jgi:hypothetical protein
LIGFDALKKQKASLGCHQGIEAPVVKSTTFAQHPAKMLISTSHSSNQYPAHPFHHVLMCPDDDN